MAITFEEKQQFNWKALITFTAIIAVVFAVAYFLFFAPSPFVEQIIPSNVKSATELSTVKLDPNDLQNNKTYQTLRQIGGPITVPQAGRANPFVKY